MMMNQTKPPATNSQGSLFLSGVGACAVAAVILMEWQWRQQGGLSSLVVVQVSTGLAVAGAGLTGIFLGTYTCALIAVTGFGYTDASQSAATLIEETLAPCVLQARAMDVMANWVAMIKSIRNLGRPGICSMAIAAVDSALWETPWSRSFRR